MEVGSGYDIPGKAGRSARFETRSVVYEVGDDHLQDLWRESMGLSIHCGTCGVDNPKRERIVDCGFGPFPDDELPYYDVSTTGYGDQVNWGRGRFRYLGVGVRWGSSAVFLRRPRFGLDALAL